MAAIGFQSLIEGFFISYHSDCFRNGLVRLCHRFQSLIEGFFISYKVPQAKAEQAVVIADCFSPSLRDFLFLTHLSVWLVRHHADNGFQSLIEGFFISYSCPTFNSVFCLQKD